MEESIDEKPIKTDESLLIVEQTMVTFIIVEHLIVKCSSDLTRQPTAVMRAAPFPLPSSDSRKLTLHWGASSFTVWCMNLEKLDKRFDIMLHSGVMESGPSRTRAVKDDKYSCRVKRMNECLRRSFRRVNGAHDRTAWPPVSVPQDTRVLSSPKCCRMDLTCSKANLSLEEDDDRKTEPLAEETFNSRTTLKKEKEHEYPNGKIRKDD
ncbi:hypothetical protein EYF80_037158 [Liparis tanakae]|uniref:Uncharacterized protein n=1 Tax=Liparis tanakae TaxID=230148 RepID=A0A4Z2GGH4_9TELE|nr:hypothetical protein EYF80_037158 [Liparis tanakae]